MKMSMGIVDWLVIVFTLVISVVIGVYYQFTGGRQKTVMEYLLADQKSNVASVSFSLMATHLSAILVIGSPSEAYSFGLMFFMSGVGKILFVPFTTFFILPVFFNMELISPYEYLEKRFSYITRCVASLLACFVIILASGIYLFVPTLAIKAITDLSEIQCMLILAILCTVYSSIGGLKAVIVTDVFQSFLMFGTAFAIIGFGIMSTGLFTIWNIAEERGRIEFFQFSLDPSVRHTFWNLIIGGGTSFTAFSVVSESYVQRFMSLKTPSKAGWAMLFSSVLIFFTVFIYTFAGIVIFSKYYDCDPVTNGRITKYDEIVSLYFMDTMAQIPGAIGLFVSGIIAASLSTISSNINSTAAIVVEDYIKPFYLYCRARECPDAHGIVYAKLFSVLAGILIIIVSLFVRDTLSIHQLIVSLKNAAMGPLLSLFVLGMCVPFANEKGALSGLFAGIFLTTWALIGEPRPQLTRLPMYTDGCDNVTNKLEHIFMHKNATAVNPTVLNEDDYFFLYKISYMWYSPLGLFSALLVGILVSYLTSKKRITSDKLELLAPPVARYLVKNCAYQQPHNNMLELTVFHK